MAPKKKGKGSSRAREALLDGGSLSAKAVAALTITFERFDADADGALSTEELQALARACNDGEEFDADELEQIGRFFETDARQRLTKKGFLDMYHTQTCARPHDTWKDLQALGFGASLESKDGSSVAAAVDAAAPPPTAAAAAAAVAAAAAGPTAATATLEPAEDAAALCSRSDELYTEGKHADSLKAALSALKLDAACAAAHRCTGRALHAMGRVEAAERAWSKANALSRPPTEPADDGGAAASDAPGEHRGEVAASGTAAAACDDGTAAGARAVVDAD